MKGERGFTIYELMVVIVLSSTVGLAIADSASRLRTENDISRAYTQDVGGMRRVTRMLRADLRNAGSIEDLTWRHDADRLYRGDREMARNVKGFAITGREEWTEVRMVVGGRRHLQAGDGAKLAFRVRMRNAGRAR